jgi:hypothetical protein
MEKYQYLINNQKIWQEKYDLQHYDIYITKNRAEKARAKEKLHLERENLKPTNKLTCQQVVALKIHMLNQNFS